MSEERVVATMGRHKKSGLRVGSRGPRFGPLQPTAPYHLVPADSEDTACGLDASAYPDYHLTWDQILNVNKCPECRAMASAPRGGR